MDRKWVIACAAMAILSGALCGCGEKPAPARTPAAKPHEHAEEPVTAAAEEPAAAAEVQALVPNQTVCPVMGGAINKAIYVDHESKRIYFCCAGCVDAFKKDPAKYIAKLKAMAEK